MIDMITDSEYGIYVLGLIGCGLFAAGSTIVWLLKK